MKKVTLDDILKVKEEELKKLLNAKQDGFLLSLKGSKFNIIAEIKRHSPSSGEISKIVDPIELAKEYVSGGVSAISVLTDKQFFQGSLDDLEKVSKAIKIPILRKDFIIHPYQITEAIKYGASAVLLISAVLKEKLKEMIATCEILGIDPLVEVHDVNELYMSLDCGAKIIGVNNRDLRTMEIDLATAENLAEKIPKGVIKVAESGIQNLGDVKRMKYAGYDAVLIGEALVRSDDPAEFIRRAKEL